MAEVISEAKLLDPRNRAKVEQALSLIFRGKAGIAGRDPALRPFVNALVLKGAVSAQEIFRRIQAQKQEEVRKATFERVLVEEMRRVGRERLTALEGPTAGESLRQFLKSEKFKRLGLPRSGTVTRVVDVGGGKMQDVVIKFRNGKIVSQKFLGKPIPQSLRFKQSRDLSRILVEKKRPLEQQKIFQEIGLKDFGERAKFWEGLTRRSQIETERLLAKKDLTPKEKRALLAIQFALPTVQLITGLKQLPAFVKATVKNPKNLVKVPKQIWDGLKQTGLEIVALAKVDPRLAVARIGGEVILLVAIGKAFKVVGQVGKGVVRSVAPILKRVRGGIIIAKTTGTKGLIKLRLVSRKTALAIQKKSKLARAVAKKTTEIKRVVKEKIKVTKVTQKIEIRKFKGRVEFANQLKKARSVRKLARQKGRTIHIGTNDYIEAVALVEDFADRLATLKARQFVKALKARGVRFGLGQQDDFIKATRLYVNKTLNNMPRFKSLKNYARLQRPFQIKLLRAKKIGSATRLLKSINSKIKQVPILKKMKSLIKKFKKIKKLPAKIKKELLKRKLKRVGRREFRKTNRYRMEKARPIRKVTFEQLVKSNTISKMNKFVDRFFDELGRRQKLNITSVKFRQLKNIIKKRLGRAIKRGDKAEIIKFRKSIKKMIDDMNKPSSKPTIKVVSKVEKPRRIRTIKDFAPEVKRGEYVEVRSGQQILLQKTKQVQKLELKQIQKVVQKQQAVAEKLLRQQRVLTIQLVQKKSISLLPLIKFVSEVLVDFFLRSLVKQRALQKSGQAQKAKQATKTVQDVKQDLKTMQDIAPLVKIKQVLRQEVVSKPKFRPVQKTRVDQLSKKPVVRRKILRELPKKKKKKRKETGFVSSVRKPRIRKIHELPLTRERALDFLAFVLDKNPSIKGRTIKSLKRVRPSVLKRQIRNVPKGYFLRHRKKFILRKLKRGREGYEMIERKRFRRDSRRERIVKRRKKG